MGDGKKVKYIQEYEESDIDLQNNKLHSALSISILISSLIMAPKDVNLLNQAEHDKHIKNGIANFLNMLSKSGYIISPVEDIPAAFKAI